MKKIEVPVFNDEYYIYVYIGTKKELVKHGAKYLEITEEVVEDRLGNSRGLAYNALRMDCRTNPLVLVDGDMSIDQCYATLAHEACHASDYIIDFLGLADESGEFRAHTVGAVMRICFKEIKKKKN